MDTKKIVQTRKAAFAKAAKKGMIHATFDPNGPGAVRLFLIPPKKDAHREPWFLSINGAIIIPLGSALAWLMKNFIDALWKHATPNEEISPEKLEAINIQTIRGMSQLYPEVVDIRQFINDLDKIMSIIYALINNEPIPDDCMPTMSMAEYAERMGAPHRMDLIVSAMRVAGKHHCPNTCPRICYALGTRQMDVESELSTAEWIQILDACWEAGIPQITFTGGEPLMRPDIVELIKSAQEHYTRLNTNSVLLTAKMAKNLFEASLDNIQVTLYSHLPDIHDHLVGNQGAWNLTVAGIKNALKAGLPISVNTPLTSLNADGYLATLTFLNNLGVHNFTCSGLIPAGAANHDVNIGKALSGEELFNILCLALQLCDQLDAEIQFTSPGWISDKLLESIGLSQPICGAGLSNMAIGPRGDALPCQSWLHEDGLGNLLTTPWEKIWNSKRTRNLRNIEPEGCPLSEVE